MSAPHGTPTEGALKADGSSRRLYYYNGGFLTQKRIRRILALAGYDLRLGLPRPEDQVVIWGNSPTAARGRRIAAARGTSMVTLEDAFVRSLHPGRAGEPPVGLVLDQSGVHFDPSRACDLEQMLVQDPLDDTALLDRARDAIARMKEQHLSKYSACDPNLPVPEPGYVLVVDQTRGDASVLASGANHARFREMLVFAQEEHPGARVVIKTHPETRAGHRPGYFGEADTNARISLLSDPVSPWHLMEGAVGVYTVSSQLGFEAILAGHKPRVFGKPFYAGWGLTQDEDPVARRERRLTRAQLFAAAMLRYPLWYDPFRDALCDLETVLDGIEAQARAWREDHQGWVAGGIRLWKRAHMQKMFGRQKPVIFSDDPARAPDRPRMAWASKVAPEADITRIEDGFVRSRGLGAALCPPLSLVTDRSGIYYDPRTPSDLERWINRRETLNAAQTRRAERLITRLITDGISKYNIGAPAPALPEGHRVLVPGQVEDDASILTGTTDDLSGNAALLAAVRTALPDAVILYKPHPDVLAGLRAGGTPDLTLADGVLNDIDPAALLDKVDAVWTLTSLLGFEALLRGVPVTTLGAPFYAGWGLTDDLSALVPARRRARPSLAGLVHATLIDYPRYRDPVTGLPCPVETILNRLEQDALPRPGLLNRGLSKLQGLFASYAYLWR